MPEQTSLLSPAKLASTTNQLKIGGIDLIIIKIINRDRIALKLLVLIFLFTLSRNLLPLCSILIKYSPIKPNIIGIIKLNDAGKNPVMFKLKNELRKTSTTLITNKNEPIYKKVVKLSLSGFKKLIFDIYFSLIAIFLLYQFIKIEIEILKLR